MSPQEWQNKRLWFHQDLASALDEANQHDLMVISYRPGAGWYCHPVDLDPQKPGDVADVAKVPCGLIALSEAASLALDQLGYTDHTPQV